MSAQKLSRDPPKWLNGEFLSSALQEGLGLPTLAVTSCQINPATAVGDNYASLMFRATLELLKTPSGQPERLSVVCKTLPVGDTVKEVMERQELSIFEKEARMLKEVLPPLNKYLMDAFPNQQPLSAECLWFGKEPEEVLVLQDLKEQGFSLLDRMGGLNLEVTNMVLNSLAKLHASSLALLHENPKRVDGLLDIMWLDETMDVMPKMLNSFLADLIETVSEWSDFPEEYLRKLKNLEGNIVEKMRESLKVDEDGINVLQHGDCWINNMMFRKENEEIKGFRFVDFQMSGLCSAGMDLNYFIFTSPSYDIRLERLDEMLETYYNGFMDTVKNLNVNLPRNFSIDDLKKDFRDRAFFGFIATIIVYPITVTESKNAMDFNDFFNEKANKCSFYQSPIFRKVFEMTLPYFIECGVL